MSLWAGYAVVHDAIATAPLLPDSLRGGLARRLRGRCRRRPGARRALPRRRGGPGDERRRNRRGIRRRAGELLHRSRPARRTRSGSAAARGLGRARDVAAAPRHRLERAALVRRASRARAECARPRRAGDGRPRRHRLSAEPLTRAARPAHRSVWTHVSDSRAASRLASDRRSEEHTSELQSHSDLVCRLLLEKNKKIDLTPYQKKQKKNTK